VEWSYGFAVLDLGTMNASGQLHAPVASPPGKETKVPIG
jgi:hypothetical protein